MTSLHTFRLDLSFDLSRLLLSVLIQLLIAVLSNCRIVRRRHCLHLQRSGDTYSVSFDEGVGVVPY